MQGIIQNRVKKLMTNLAKDFKLEKLSKSPARFNIEKLNWFNREYIKKLELEEFCWRCFQNKIASSLVLEGNFQVKDYIMFVDLKTQRVLVNSINFFNQQGNKNYLIGGSRKSEMTGIESLLIEIKEKIPQKLDLDTNKLLKITSFRIKSSEPFTSQKQEYTGQEFHLYFYPISEDQISTFYLDGDNSFEKKDYFSWIDLVDVIGGDDFLSYPIWKEFCRENKLPCFSPTEKIVEQYLAWNLDKNRITVLSEFGTESNVVLKWQKPSIYDLKWKKNTEQESLQNLQEISQFLYSNLPLLENLETKKEYQNLPLISTQNPRNDILVNTYLKNNLASYHRDTTEKWEARIKKWLQDNQKDTGSYLWPLRVALSGKVKSPSQFELLAILSPLEVKSRISQCLSTLKK